MARQLEDLVGVKFSDMTHEEKVEFVKKVRKSRRTPKATSRVVKKRKREQKKTTKKFEDLFASLPPEEQAKLLKELEDAG
jgi:Tfp pilus assembly protein PilN